MRHRTEDHLPGRCTRCWLKQEFCVCLEIPRVDTATRFVIVRHKLEGRKSTNTARVAPLALPGCVIWEYDGPEENLDTQLGALPGAWLLFPGGDVPVEVPAVQNLVVLDGTWKQVRKMSRKLPSLLRMPKLSLRPLEGKIERLRHSDDIQNMSTLEAMAQAVAFLDSEEKGAALHLLHRKWVDRTLVARGKKRSDIL